MKKSIFIIVALLFMLCATPVSANGIPQLPHAFYGTVEINGGPAPIGSTISAIGDGVEPNTLQNPVKTTQFGSYGIDSLKLLVQGEIADGAIITFYVNGYVATTDPVTVEWHSEETTRVDLTVAEVEPVPEVAPTVVNNAASAVTTTSATLNGNLTGLGTASSVEVSFEWGTTDAYGNETATETMTATGSFTAALSGLSPNTSYHFIAKVVGDDTGYGVDSTFTTATTPTPPPGGGGGPAPPLPPGTTDVRGIVTTAGVFTESFTTTSECACCTLYIPEGTVGLTEELEPLDEITLVPMDEPPPPPEDAHVIGLGCDFGPDGATFAPPITLTLSYDPDALPEGVAEEDLVLAYYDEDAGEWVELDCVVDTENNIITASVAHFTTFAIIGSITPPPEEEEVIPVGEEEEEEEEEVIPVGEEEEEEEEEVIPVGEEEEEEEEEVPTKPGINWPLIGGIIGGVIVVGLGVFFWMRRRAA